MDFTPLQPEQRQSFEADGFLVVRNALDRETVRLVTEAGDRLAAAFLNKPEVPNRPEYNHLDLRPGLLKEKALFDLVTNSSTVPLVVQLLSPNIHLHSTSLLYKRPSRPDVPSFRRGWHRDIRIPRDLGHQSLPRVGLKICYCLTDFHQPNSGMTVLARQTHLRTEPLKVPKNKFDPEDVEICDLKLNAGDAFLFENRIFHTAAPNLSDRVSKVFMYGYAYRWMKPEIYLEPPDYRQLGNVEPVIWQLLGGYRDIDTLPFALERWAKRHNVLPQPVPWTVDS